MAEGNSAKDISTEVNQGGSSDEYSIFGANVPVSPPQSISVEDMLRMKAEVENMILTHEAALEENFRLEKSNAESNSLEGRVRAIVEKAFWDVLEEQLNEDPPNYSQAMVLFQEIKQELLDLLPPTRHSIKDMIEEVLDVELIKQKLQHSVFDLGLYARFVVDIMAKLCAPVRDEDVAKLNAITEVMPLYREIFRVLELMKLDLANFTLSLIKPHLKQHSVEIERKKFLEILKIQQQNGIDGLRNTKLWLASSLSSLQTKQRIAASGQESAGTGQEAAKEGGSITANDVLNESYLRLLIAGHDRRSIAETLLVDCHRLDELRNNFGLLVLVSSVLAISTSAAGQLDEEFKKKLRIQIFTLTQNVPPSEYRERSLALCDQVVKELNGWLRSKNMPVISESSEKLLRDQMMNIMDPNATSNPVCKLMGERLCSFLSQIISNPNLKNIDTPRGFASLAIELKQFGGQFASIISHNQAVFGGIYSDIIGDLMRKHATGGNTQESN